MERHFEHGRPALHGHDDRRADHANRRCDNIELLELGRAYAMAAAAEGWKGPLNVQLKRASGAGWSHTT